MHREGCVSRLGRVAANALSTYGRSVVSLAVVFFLTPAIIRCAGQEDFGLWSLTFAIVGILGLLDMAGMAGVVKWVAECRGSGDIDRRNRLLSTVAGVYLGISVFALVVIAVFALFYEQLFGIPEHLRDKALSLLWILAIRQVVLAVPLLLFKGILFGEQRIVLVNVIQTSAFLAYGLGGLYVLHMGWGIVGLAWVNLAAMLLEHTAYIVFSYVRVPDLRLSWSLADRSLLREVVSFSAAQLVINVAGLIRMRTDLILVRFFVSLAVVPVYAIAMRLAEVAYLLVKQFINVLAPLHAQLAAEGEDETLRAMLIHVAKFALVPMVVATSAGYVLGRDAIVFWVGPEFADAGSLLHILMTALVLGVPPLLAFTMLGMTGHHGMTARAAAISIVVNLGASIALVLPLETPGIALGTLVSTAVIDVGLVLRWACRIHDISLATQVRRVYWPAIWPAALQAGLTYAIAWQWPPTGLLTVALCALPGVALYLVVFWLFSTERVERESVRALLRRRRGG